MVMRRRVGREEDMESLPSLEETARGPPRSLRFKEPSPMTRRQTSKLPELRRRESIVSTYRNEIYQPRIVTFMRNGDRFFEGIKVNVSSRNFKHWEVLLSELSRSMALPAGVRNIYSPETGHRVTDLSQFQHQRTYVCASTEPFKRIGYGNTKTPTWHAGTKVKQTGTLLDLSRNMQGLDRSVIGQGQTAMDTSFTSSLGFTRQTEDGKERKRKRGCVRKLSFHASQPPVSVQSEQQVPHTQSLHRKRSSTTAILSPSEPTPFTIICNGPPPRTVVTVFLDRHSIMSWEQARSLISENLQCMNGCLRLYSVDGVEVGSLSQLWSTSKVLIATGHGDFDIGEFLRGSRLTATKDAQATNNPAHVLPPEVQMAPEGYGSSSLPHSPVALQQNTVQQSETDLEVSPLQMGQVDTSKEMEKEEERREGEGREGEGIGGKRDSDSEWERECERKEREDKSATTPTAETQTSPVEVPGISQEQQPVEQTSSVTVEPEENQVYPTTSALTLTEDESFIGSGSPLTVAKAASLQYLHRMLAQSVLSYDDERFSASGSECSTDIQFASTRRASLICPQTPQSNISFSTPQSLVEMILPKENGLKSDTSSWSASTSSRQTSLPNSRTIGIQTDLIGDTLSTVIEEDQQPFGLGASQRKPRLTHPLFHTRTSIVSQTDLTGTTANANRSHRQKDNYSVGSVLGEGRFAVVRECHHKMTGKKYSLRIVNKTRIFGQEDLIRQECEVLRSMKHQNLVQVLDGWETSDDICMVVEHVEGADLFDAVLHCQHFSEADAVLAVKQLSMALVYLHAHKIVHRDIKLENIFLHQLGEEGWCIKLGGMGLATTVSEPLSLLCGTTYYMAPEMITETGYGTKLDVWAAGVICCILLSGIMPFGSTSKRATMSNIKRGKYAFISPFWDKVSNEAKDFIRHLLVVSPRERYMATQMLQHPWIERERWEGNEGRSELGKALREHLVSKSTSAKNAAISTLIVTALDKRKALPDTQSKHMNRRKKSEKRS